MKAKQVIVMLLAMISFMCFGLSFNKIEAAASDNTYQHVFRTQPSNGSLSGVSWTLTSTNLGSYNNTYKGVQFGTKNDAGEIKLITDWFTNGTYGNIESIILYVNEGSGAPSATVSVGGVTLTGTGSFSKNTSVASWDKVSSVTYSTGNVKTGEVVIDITCSNASYLSAIIINCAATTSDPVSEALNSVNAKMALSYTYSISTTTGNVTKLQKVTSVDELVDGNNYYFVGNNEDGNAPMSITRKSDNTNFLVVEKVTFDNSYLIVNSSIKPITININISNNKYTFKFLNEYLNSTAEKTLSYSTTDSSEWTITFDSNGLADISTTSGKTTLYLRYNPSFPRFTTYKSGQNKIAIYKEVTVQGEIETYSNSQFVIKCGLDTTATDNLINLEDVDSYGIFVKCGEETRYYDFSGTSGYRTDNTQSLYYINISLGDVITNGTHATDKFTIGAYVKKDSDKSYVLSSTTKQYSVADLVKTYYVADETKEAVTDLYNLFTDRGYYAA